MLRVERKHVTPTSRPERALRIGTRGSQLARWQADRVATVLLAHDPELQVEIVTIASHGDLHGQSVRDLDVRGIFTREIETALLDGLVDVAVHSLKDLPTETPDGLELAAVLPRDDPRDVLVAATLAGSDITDSRAAIAALPARAHIATSSLRRRAELLHARPDLDVVELRGNVPTRIAKVERREVDGVVLSLAGLLRLDLRPAGAVPLDPDVMLPAPGQGTIAVQARRDDRAILDRVSPIDDRATRVCTTAERMLLHALEGGCRVPIGALAQLDSDGETVHLRARIATADGKTRLEESASGSARQLADLVRPLAKSLLIRGAANILASLRSSTD
jgi:hydroxymethylbilane synthase